MCHQPIETIGAEIHVLIGAPAEAIGRIARAACARAIVEQRRAPTEYFAQTPSTSTPDKQPVLALESTE